MAVTYEVKMKQELNEYYACEQWVFKNCVNLLHITLVDDGYDNGGWFIHKFVFDNENEAVMFKLRWSNEHTHI